MQLTHYDNNFRKQKFPIVLVCDDVTSSLNIGSLFRTADAFGLEKLILSGKNIQLGRKMIKTSRATEKVVDFEIKNSAIEAVENLKAKGYDIISLEITNSSKAINNVNFIKNKPLALVIGNENFGVSEQILKLSDNIVHINMFGQNSSMNVVQAANIALYEITKQFL